MGREWGTKGVRVNAIRPGFFPTGGTAKTSLPKIERPPSWHTPMARYRGWRTCWRGNLLDIWRSVFCHGFWITVDGGFSCMTIWYQNEAYTAPALSRSQRVFCLVHKFLPGKTGFHWDTFLPKSRWVNVGQGGFGQNVTIGCARNIKIKNVTFDRGCELNACGGTLEIESDCKFNRNDR